LPSNLAASSPGEQHEGDDQQEDNQHPVLHFEAKKTEFLNEKLHSVAPFLCKMRPLAEKIYYFDTTEESASIFGCETLRRKSRASLRTWRGKPSVGDSASPWNSIGRREQSEVRSSVRAQAAYRIRMDLGGSHSAGDDHSDPSSTRDRSTAIANLQQWTTR
jgi:hypothetical protein